MNNMLYKALALGVLNILQLLFYNLRHPNRTSFGFVNLKKNLQPMNCKSISIWGCQKKKKKNLFCILKYYFIYSTNLFYNSLYILVFIFIYNSIK